MNTYFSPKVELTETELLTDASAAYPVISIIGPATAGAINNPVLCNSLKQFINTYGLPKYVSQEAACYLFNTSTSILFQRITDGTETLGSSIGGTAKPIDGTEYNIADKVLGSNSEESPSYTNEQFIFETKNCDSIFEGFTFTVKYNTEAKNCELIIKSDKGKVYESYSKLKYLPEDRDSNIYLPTVLKERNSDFTVYDLWAIADKEDADNNRTGEARLYKGSVKINGVQKDFYIKPDTLSGDRSFPNYETGNTPKTRVMFGINDGGSNINENSNAYITALENISNPDVHKYIFLLTPGCDNPIVHEAALELAEKRNYNLDSDRFVSRNDFVYFPDVKFNENVNDFLNGSSEDNKSAHATVSVDGGGYLYDSSYCTLYYPDLIVKSGYNNTNVEMPASVIGCYINLKAANATGNLWTPGAGCGSAATLIDGVVSSKKLLTVTERDALCKSFIPVNPITFTNGIGFWINGNKTSKYNDVDSDESLFSNLHIRKLLNLIKERVTNISNKFLFKVNNPIVWQQWTLDVSTLLDTIKGLQGIDLYKVKMDEETTTTEDIRNNTVRGFIWIKPNRVIEYIPISVNITDSNVYFDIEGE